MNILQRMRTALLGLLLLTPLVFGGVLVPSTAYAETSKQAVCNSIGNCDSKSSTNLSDVIKFVVNLLSYIAGAVAVIMVIVAGFKYMTAAGDASKVASAKTTLIYAIIGIIIIVLAQFIVQFTIGKTSQAVSSGNPIVANLSEHAIK